MAFTNLFVGFWNQMRSAVNSVWTDVLPANSGGGVHRQLSVEKIDWTRIALPYAVLITPSPASISEDSGLHTRAYNPIVDITYLCTDQMRSGSTTVEHIENKLALLEEVLWDYGWTDGVQVLQVMHYDMTPSNPVNEVLLGLQMPYSAGTLRVMFEIGEEFVED